MDIVTRLRKAQQTFYGDTSINELHMYAADEIERLREDLWKIMMAYPEESYAHVIAKSALQQKRGE